MEIVAMQAEHIVPVWAIEKQANPFPWSRKNFEDSLQSGYQGWLGYEEDKLIAYAVVQTILDETHLLNICVTPLMQAKGYGKQMLYHVISLAQQRASGLVVLEVRRSNHRAQRLYSNLGFNEMSIRRGYYPALNGREDAVLMGLTLFADDLHFSNIQA